MDDHAPANKREAALRLLLPLIRDDPPRAYCRDGPAAHQATLATASDEDLRWLVTDPRNQNNLRAAAYTILHKRGTLLPRTSQTAAVARREADKASYFLMRERVLRDMGFGR